MCLKGQWYLSPWPIALIDSIQLNRKDIPTSFALFRSFSGGKMILYPIRWISGSPVYSDTQQGRDSCQWSSVHFDLMKIAFWKLVAVSTICRTDFC